MKLRDAVLSETPQLAELHRRSVLELAAEYYSKKQVEAWVKGIAPDNYRQPILEGRLTVVEAEGRIAGFSIVGPEPGRLGLLYVNPDFARQGVGRLLVEKIEAEALDRGLDLISLDSSLNALAFYEKLGFVEIGRGTNVWQGVVFPRIQMEKRLRQPPGGER